MHSSLMTASQVMLRMLKIYRSISVANCTNVHIRTRFDSCYAHESGISIHAASPLSLT